MNGKLVSKTLIAGGIIAAVAIGLFFVLWLALASLEPFLRLFLAVCVPPALMTGAIGLYILSTRNRQTPDASPQPIQPED